METETETDLDKYREPKLFYKPEYHIRLHLKETLLVNHKIKGEGNNVFPQGTGKISITILAKTII